MFALCADVYKFGEEKANVDHKRIEFHLWNLWELYPGGMSMLEDKEVRLPVDVRNAGMKALQEALEPVGMVKFMQQYDMGYGDYTMEKQEQPDMSLEEIDMLLKNGDNR